MMDLPNVNTDIVNQEEVAIATSRASAESFDVNTNSVTLICVVDFKNPTIDATNASVKTGPGTFYNRAYGNSWLMHYPGQSFIRLETNIESFDSTQKYTLDLFHLSSIVNRQLMDARISIYVNGKAVVCGHNPNDPNYIHQQFDVTGFVSPGSNTIELRFDDGAQTNYWIQSLVLSQS